MGKIFETVVTDFGGGMTPDLRDKSKRAFAFSYHLDVLDNKRSLKPKRAYTTITDGSEKITDFMYAEDLSASGGFRMYGLGEGAGSKSAIYKGDDFPVSAWTLIDTSTTGLPDKGCLFKYRQNLYFWQNRTVLSSIDLLLTPNITEAVATLSDSYATIAQPVHHPDDIAYFFYDNFVSKLDKTTPTAKVLILPDNLKIVGGAPYGSYLAILCSAKTVGSAESVLYIWDRDTSLNDVSAKVNLGFGEAVHIGHDNNGIFITQIVSRVSGLGQNNEAVIVKYWNGRMIEKRINVSATEQYFNTASLSGVAVSTDNVFFFPLKLITSKDAVTYNVIMGATIVNGEIIMTANQNISGLASDEEINGIYEVGGTWFVSHSDSTTIFSQISSVYQQGAIETLLYDGGDSSVTKKLLGVTVMTAAMTSTSQIVLLYRKDEETSWTTIYTDGTDDSISHTAINIESSSATLPEYKEIQFRIESTGGAEITGLKFRSEEIDKDIL